MRASLLAILFLGACFAQKPPTEVSHDESAPPLPANIFQLNTKQSDFAPFIMPHGTRIYLSSSRDGGFGGEDIYYSDFVEGYWTEPKNLGDHINSRFSESSTCVSPSGEEMFITICGRSDSYGGCDIYVCRRKGDEWSEPRNLGDKINSSWWDGHPTLSPSGETLYFASDRYGGFGGTDIYYATKSRGAWTKCKNLGFPINNARDQTSPFLHIDGTTLYFSSWGHGGLGGLDVFVSRLDSVSEKWGNPLNIGAPVNTNGNDYFFSVPGSGDFIYFSSDREGGLGGFDIYSYPLADWQRPSVVATLAGTVVDAQTGKAITSLDGVFIPAEVTIERLSDGKVVQVLETDSTTGSFFVVLKAGENYGISVSAPGYAFASENYEIRLEDGYNELHHTFKIRKVEVGSIVSLVNIFFDFGKSELRHESEPELQRIIELMTDYPEMKIEVQGFADSVGNKQFNLFLSRMRAQAVAQWIVAHGIPEKRVAHKGFGEESTGATEEELQQSRRVQFQITNLGSAIKTKDDKASPTELPKPEPPKKIEEKPQPVPLDTSATKPPPVPVDTIAQLPQKTADSVNYVLPPELIDTIAPSLNDYLRLIAARDMDSLATAIYDHFINKNAARYFTQKVDIKPVAVKRSALGYPQKARAQRIEGIVLLEFDIDTLGSIVPSSANIIKALPEGIFEGVALEAIYHWKYSPAVFEGKKTKVHWVEPLVFKLNAGLNPK